MFSKKLTLFNSNNGYTMIEEETKQEKAPQEEKPLSFIFGKMTREESLQKMNQWVKNLDLDETGPYWCVRESTQEGMLAVDRLGKASMRYAYTSQGWEYAVLEEKDFDLLTKRMIPLTKESAARDVVEQLLKRIEERGLDRNKQMKPLSKAEATQHAVLNDYCAQEPSEVLEKQRLAG